MKKRVFALAAVYIAAFMLSAGCRVQQDKRRFTGTKWHFAREQ